MAIAPMTFVPTLPPEEAARANFYGLLARLLHSPPDAALLEALAGAGEMDAEDGGISAAWRSLREAANEADLESIRDEYDTVFVGTGKAPITLYTCAYSIRYSNEAPLVALRGDLAALGLGRRLEAHEPEDHIAALCEVMRHLITQGKPLKEQKRFFERWIWPTVPPLCAAIDRTATLRFYRTVGEMLLAVCTIEHSSFEML